LWFIDQLGGASAEYNMPEALLLRGELDREAFGRAVQTIVDRHEILRTHFMTVDGDPVQVIAPGLRIDAPLTDLVHLDETERQSRVAAALRDEQAAPCD
jgi:hypothetical protein